MATEGVENFQAIVVSIAAFSASVIAGMGLWVWKQQQRWQRGRGVAIDLLMAANKILNSARQVRQDFAFFDDERKSMEERRARFDYLRMRTEVLLSRLKEELEVFEETSIEAELIWDISFREQTSCFRDAEHSIRSYLLCGLAMISTDAGQFERNQNRKSYNEFYSDIYGHESIFRGMNEAIDSLKAKIIDRFPR